MINKMNEYRLLLLALEKAKSKLKLATDELKFKSRVIRSYVDMTTGENVNLLKMHDNIQSWKRLCNEEEQAKNEVNECETALNKKAEEIKSLDLIAMCYGHDSQ